MDISVLIVANIASSTGLTLAVRFCCLPFSVNATIDRCTNCFGASTAEATRCLCHILKCAAPSDLEGFDAWKKMKS